MIDKQSDQGAEEKLSKTDENLYQNADLPGGTDPGDQQSIDLNHDSQLREAAVLIPLLWQHNQWEILYIRRTVHEKDRHSGQVAFPGGARDADDQSLIATALREANEETGIKPDSVTIIQPLHPYLTISQYTVLPVVGVLEWPQTLVPEPNEVARIFTIPLNWLANKNNFEVVERSPENKATTGLSHPVIYFDRYDDELLWGATARMTLNFLKALDDSVFALP